MRKLGFPASVKLDLSKLILGGYSFGGLTALCTAKKDERIKLVCTLDPFHFSHVEEVLAGELALKVPHISVTTELFHPSVAHEYPSWDVQKKLMASSKTLKVENIVVKNTAHLH